MKIYGNEELLKIRTQINELLKLFASELETVNNDFTPEFIRLKKRKSNIMYYIIMTLFLFIFICFTVFLGVLEAFYLILLVYALNILLSGYGIFLLRKTNKSYNEVKNLWDNKYKEVLKYQTKVNSLYELAEVEVYKTIVLTLYHDDLFALKDNAKKCKDFYDTKLKLTKLEVSKSIGNNQTSEAVVAYYTEWGKEITAQTKSDFDYLEARRRKATLSSKNIDIDSK